MIEWLLLAIFPAAMLVAAASDVATYRIPNWLVAGLAAAFPGVALAGGLGLETVAWHLGVAVLALLGGMVLFALRLIGAGDAKLLAAAALWLGPSAIMLFLGGMAFVGGALGLALLVFRKLPLPLRVAQVGWVARLHDPRLGIPYGLAIAAGGLIAFPVSAVARALSLL